MKITNPALLEEILKEITTGKFISHDGHEVIQVSVCIGKTENRVIVIQSLGRTLYEREFNEKFDDMATINFCVGMTDDK